MLWLMRKPSRVELRQLQGIRSPVSGSRSARGMPGSGPSCGLSLSGGSGTSRSETRSAGSHRGVMISPRSWLLWFMASPVLPAVG